MIKQKLTIQNKLGVHARVAAKMVDTARRFGSRIELTYKDRTIDCKSIMSVITLGAKKDDVIDVQIHGDDEQEAFESLQKLVNGKFGED